MEKAQKNLKNYALANSSLAQENFISDSLRLDEIRMERRKVSEIADLLSIIERLIMSGKLDDSSYEALRSTYPLLDDIEFRRILGMSETISAWTWPEIELIEAVTTTLRDRIKRLDSDINNIEKNAKIYAASAEDLAKYTRDAKISEATYTVLIEQVKAQSLAAGFKPETFKVFEYATPPLNPISPKRNLILAAGMVFGTFIGCAFALLNSIRRNVYYSRSTLLSNVNADLALKSKTIRQLSRKSISDIILFIAKRRVVALDEAAIKLMNKKIIYVVNSGGRPTGAHAARLLAVQSAQSGRNVVLCDATGQAEKKIDGEAEIHSSGSPIVSLGNNLSIMTGTDEATFFTSIRLKSVIKDLANKFDQVFVCSSNKNSQLGLMALDEFSPGLVLVAGLRKTRKIDIQNIKTKLSVDLLFYE